MEEKRAFYSCPGKVLIAGGKQKGSRQYFSGYAILNPKNQGISLATEKFFLTSISMEKSNWTEVIFKSPQIMGEWHFLVQYQEDAQRVVRGMKATVWIFHSPEFYSAHDQASLFDPIGPLDQLSKTGLGSSSALVVSVVAAFLGISKTVENEKTSVLSLSLEINHRAQRKIGSGFDISTCVFGSQLYQRPNPNEKLPQLHEPLELGKEFQLLLIDLKIGQNTIKSVSSVTAFLRDNPEFSEKFHRESQIAVSELYSELKNPEINRQKIREINKEYRKLLKETGHLAKCEIEPDLSTFLIDEFMNNEDFLWGICPGAGGYDAIAFLVHRKERLNCAEFQGIISSLKQNCNVPKEIQQQFQEADIKVFKDDIQSGHGVHRELGGEIINYAVYRMTEKAY